MRYSSKSQIPAEKPTPPTTSYSINIKTDASCNIDSISQLYGVKIEDIVVYSQGGNFIMNIPVKKILKTRYFDNLATLEKQYGTSQRRIMIVNNFHSTHVAPGTNITIPF